MTRARRQLVCTTNTPFYHVTTRCVRRAYLCGRDAHSGRNFAHRRKWIEQRLITLSSVFSIQLYAYAIMSNHYHLVVKIDEKTPHKWTDAEVFARWCKLFRGPLLVQRYLKDEPITGIERNTLSGIATVFRHRLASLSWYMKCLNEFIARNANAEDECTGHFWQARFHSQALTNRKALIAAMAYVDLNPVRAGISKSPTGAEFTSIRARIRASIMRYKCHWLAPFLDTRFSAREPRAPNRVPVRESEYFSILKNATSRIRKRSESAYLGVRNQWAEAFVAIGPESSSVGLRRRLPPAI